ncbi:glutamine--fructose-6-phosphate transaminase (isomerizing) [Candidatus Giovannonibacteria bacterium]|nr:glutamine--fructose-6-phosphate transaminase (isomerizing) [Candidatus Giovannonibacteria bacterium]
MCGIVGYIGKRQALPIVIEGLKRLEYRGYDSAGVALWDGKKLQDERAAGRISVLEGNLQRKSWAGNLAIAHTRWATHGKPSEANAHPQSDCTKGIEVVHNGIIENHAELREALIREGHKFVSDTDTEVISHLIERAFLVNAKEKILLEHAVLDGLRHVTGTFGIAVISKHDPRKLVAARRGSPLILGIGKDEFMVSSDVSAIVEHTRKVVYLHDDELAVLTPQGYEILGFNKKTISKPLNTIDWDVVSAQKGGYPHFMKKEIFEGPETLENAFRGRLLEAGKGGLVKLGGIEEIKNKLLTVRRILVVACGTSYYAGLVGKYFFENFSRIPCSVEHASEFRYSNPVLEKNTLVIAISQSGETADTLEALRDAKKRGALAIGIVNVVGSTIARESDAGVYNHAGPEIGVASTKAFLSQLGVLALLAMLLGKEKEAVSEVMLQKFSAELKSLPVKIKKILAMDEKIRKLAEKYLKYDNFLFLGRKYQYPVALEGALKLKEISYKYAEGLAAGEMKHGPIALVDEDMPCIVLAPKDSVYEKMLSNIEEIKARGGKILAVATEGDERIAKLADDVIYIPHTMEEAAPFLSVVPLQLFAYHTSDLLGLDVDKPRNLAKSVTVE